MKNKFLISLRALTLLLVMCLSIGNVWGAITSPYTGTPSGSASASGGDITMSEVKWSYGSANYLSINSSNYFQIGSKNNPQTSDWTISTAISNFGSNVTITGVTIAAYTASAGTYDIKVGGTSQKSGDLSTTTSSTYSVTGLSVSSGNIEIVIVGTVKAAYLGTITVTFTTGGGSDPSLSLSPTSIDFGSVEKGKSVDAKSVTATLTNTTYAAATLSGDNAEAFEITAGEELTETGTITVQPKSATLQTAGTYSASLDVEADNVTGTKSATISLIVTEPFVEEGVSFEQEWSAYTDWSYKNFASKQTGTITAHKGTYYGTTGGSATGYMVTKNKVNPNAISFFVTRQTTNTTSSTWKLQVSSDNSNWTDVKTQSATSMNKGTWVEVSQDLSSYSAVYVRIYYDGGTAVRNIDDVVLTTRTLTKSVISKATGIEHGDVSATVGGDAVVFGTTEVSEGATVTLSSTPASGYTCTGYSVYKTGDQSTTVTVTDGKFTMPAYAVTVSATFAVGIATPELDLASGTYDGEQLALVSNYDDDYMYFYTNDGTDPAADGNLDPTGTSKTYDKDEGITISSSSTIKVVAYDLEGNHSAISTYTYTINPVYTSIAQFKTDQPENACKVSFTEASNVVVTAVSGKNVYVQDASGNSIILYFSANSSWTVGKKVTGYFYAKYATYLNMPEMSITNNGDVAATIDGSLPAATEITDLSASNLETKLTLFVKAKSVYFQSQSLSSKSVVVKDASENPVTLYDRSEIFGSKNLPLTATASDVTGVLIKFGYNEPYIYELLPANADAISTNGAEAQIDVDPVGGATAETAEPLALNAEVTITPVTGFATTYNTAAITEVTKVAITGNTTIAVEASRDFYTTKSVTYYYKVDESSKAIVVNQPAEGGTIAADKASASAGATITLSHSAAPHYTFGSFTVVDASSNPVTVNENEGVYTFEMPNSDVTVTGTFNLMNQYTASFVAGAAGATGSVDPIARYMDELTFALPANGFSYAGHTFAGWSDGDNVYQPGDNYTLVGNKEFTATWEALSVWATTYTSNVTGIGTSNKVKISGTDYNANKQNKGASTSVTVPAGATALHFHALAWTGEAQTITVSGTCFTEALPFDIVADNGVSGSGSTYTLQTDPSQVGYFSIPLSDIEADTEVTFQAASGKRFVLFGVNAVQPASMTIEPTEWDFGNVKENASADKVFAVTPNAFVEGALSATFEGTDAAKFSAVVDGNNVTVTFTPSEIRDNMSATLKVSASNANVTASLSGSGIPATTPEIVVPAEPVNFGKIKQEASVSDQQVTVTLNNLDAATASISGSVFSIDKTALVAGENTITISANTSVSAGEYSETITITGTGAEEKQITVNMEILSKWADTYTSNVEDAMTGADDVTVVINSVSYPGVKIAKGGTATVTVPKGTHTLHFHAAAWNGEAQTITVASSAMAADQQFDIVAESDISGTKTTYTLAGNNYSTEQYFHVALSNVTEPTTVTFTAATNKRFVLYGVNQEGGIVPVLDHLVIEGTATKTEYEVGDDFNPTGMTVKAIYTLEDVEQGPIDVTDDVEWTYVPASLTAGSYNVTATANYEGKSVSKDIAVTVSAATPEITVSPTSVDFGSVEQNASVDAKTVAVTLKAIEGNATVELSGAGAGAFAIDQTSMSASGNITITPNTASVGVFAAVITISAKDAESVEIPVSMTVTEVAPTYTYTLVTDASDLMPGDVIIIGTAITNGFKVASSYNSTDKLLSPTDDGDATEAEGVVTTGYAMEFILGGTEGAWTLTSNDGVLGVYTAKKITFDPSVNNYTNTWTIAIDDNKATIASTNSSYGKILYNVSSPRFLNYTSDATSTMLLPKIYRKDNKGTVTTVRTNLTIGRYGTICLPRGIEAGQFTGAIFYSITYKDVANSLLIADEVKSLEAGRPYLFLATDTKIKARLNDDAVAEPVNDAANNGLYGVFEKLVITDLNVGDGIYMLMNDVLYNAAVDSWLAPNRAYVKLSEVSETVVGQVAGRRRMVASTPKSTPTDVEEIFNAQSVNGKFLINGQLFILRDGKTYDAQGKLVK